MYALGHIITHIVWCAKGENKRMYVYIIAFGLSILIASQIKKVKNFNTIIKVIFSSLPVVLITGLRYDVGTDFFSYDRYFRGYQKGIQIEVLFQYLTNVLYQIDDNYQFFIFVTGSIFVIVMFFAIWEQSKEIEFGILLFMLTTLYFCGMNAVRQGLAIGIVLYAMKFLESDSKSGIIKFVIATIIAVLIHDTVIICIAFPVLKKLNINFGKSVIGLVLVLFFNYRIYEYAGYIVKRFSLKHYGSFINTGAVDFGESYIIIVVGTFLFASYIKTKYDVDETFNMYYNIMLCSIILGIFTVWLAWGKRLMWNYMFVSIFLIPKSVSYIRKYNVRLIAKSGFIIALFVLMYYSIAILKTHGCVPYQWIL